MAGRVVVEGVARPKAGALVPEAARVTVRNRPPLSAGRRKLAGAPDHFGISPAGQVALAQPGASTGGFTHCSHPGAAC